VQLERLVFGSGNKISSGLNPPYHGVDSMEVILLLFNVAD
jgi:hypothetical protein